ncbi:soma ferritin-like [Sorex fumeus]|uniref:soma ferritin-like n=1 Tax=Sorex fumeus TaxID=62283 RepID=UPI0024AC9618|nr:soma ferritin-like [Sorex fumeus]
MTFGYTDDLEVPYFIPFFEDQVKVKKEHARQFIRFLKSSGAKISLPVIKRPDIQTWETGKPAIKTALDLEKQLDLLLKDLNTVAERNGEAEVNNFLREFLMKQKNNLSYLDYQLSYQQHIEEKVQEEAEAEAERQQQ